MDNVTLIRVIGGVGFVVILLILDHAPAQERQLRERSISEWARPRKDRGPSDPIE